MSPTSRSAGTEMRAVVLRTTTVWSPCVRAAFWKQLRFMWQLFTLLTVLCVLMQLFGVVRQFRDTKIMGPTDAVLVRSLSHRQEREILYSIPTAATLDSTNSQTFQWKGRKNERLTTHQRNAHGFKTAQKGLDTTVGRRFTGTTKRIFGPFEDLLATKLVPPSDFRVGAELKVTRSTQNPKSPDVNGFLPKVLSTQFPPLPPTPPFDGDKNQAINPLDHDESGKCRPKNHMVFLKTHKTASSTILNMLYRYGDSRNLTFALPTNRYSQLYYPMFFMRHFVEGLKFGRVKEFHIMCNHMRFQGMEVRKVMPMDTFFFSILRNPVFMMESIFSYYKSIPAFQNFKTLEEFLKDDGRSFSVSKSNNHYAQNILTFDFGFNNSSPTDEDELDRRSSALIASVESNFHLILISEYFDESMVLLKHTLCWELEDVVSFRLNSRNDKSRNPLSEETAERVKRWNSLDWRLYVHFNATFWHRIDTLLGRDKLQEEVEALRARRAELEKVCLLGGGAVDPGQVKDSSLKPFQYGLAVIQGYNIRPGLDPETHLLCQRLITPELQYTNSLYAKQFPDLFQKQQAAAKMAAAKQLAVKHSVLQLGNGSNVKGALPRRYFIQTKKETVKNVQSNTNTVVPDFRKLEKMQNYNAQILENSNTGVRSHAQETSAAQLDVESQTKAIKHNSVIGHNFTHT